MIKPILPKKNFGRIRAHRVVHGQKATGRDRSSSILPSLWPRLSMETEGSHAFSFKGECSAWPGCLANTVTWRITLRVVRGCVNDGGPIR